VSLAAAPLAEAEPLARDLALPLACVTRVAEVVPDAGGLTLHVETTLLQHRLRDRYGTVLETADPVGPGPPAVVRLGVVSPAVVRLRFTPGGDVPANDTPMLAGPVPASSAFAVEGGDGHVALRTAELELRVDLDPYRLVLRDARGATLLETVPAAVYQQPPTGEADLLGGEMADAWPWLFRGLLPLGFVEDPHTGEVEVFDTAVLPAGEHLYGLGERFMGLDRRGQAVRLWQANAAGNTWPEAYKNVPFLVSTAGWGHFVNAARPVTYHLGDRSHVHWTLHVQDRLLDAFLIAGPRIADVLPRYTALTGAPAVPPLWSFGLWMSRMSYRSQAEVEEVARRLRAEEVPCDVLHVDTDWFATAWVNDLEFSPERFPDPAGLVAGLGEQGFRLSLWQLPYISTRSALYEEGRSGGHFARGPDGEPRHIDGFFGPAAVVDFSDPAAAAWYCARLEPLLRLGVAAIKTDFGEGAPPDATYAGADGLAMHNLYPLLYNRAVAELTERVRGERFVWARSAYAGSQRYPVHWGGDPAVRWSDLGALPAGGLSLGLCGFPFWSVDIGGFAGVPDPRLYVRWAQLGLFMTHPRVHGANPREPWVFGDEALALFRRFATLRYRLLPYVWSEAHAAARASHPVMRPLVLDFQDDPTTWPIHDEFLFGRSLLVAPVLTPEDRRRVYLPAGAWLDLERDLVLHGPAWHDVPAPLEVLPRFLRAGGMLPLAAPARHTGELVWDHLTLEAFPVAGSRLDLVDADRCAHPLVLEREAGRVRLVLDGARRFTVRLRALGAPARVTLDGREASWTLDGATLVVDAPRGARELVVEL